MFEITRTPTGVTWVRCRRCQASSAERSDARIAAWKLDHSRQCSGGRTA